MRWQVDKVAGWQNDKLTRWKIVKMEGWQKGQLTK